MSSTEHERLREGGAEDRGGVEAWDIGQSAMRSSPVFRRSGTPWAYRRAALCHPSNIIALAAILMLGLVSPSAELVLFGLSAEVIFLCAAPRSRFIRRCLDEGQAESAQAERARAREALIAKMADHHREELRRLDSLIKRIEEGHRRGAELTLEDHMGLTRLTESYIRLALAHRACEEALMTPEQRSLRASLRALEAAQQAAPERVRAAIQARLAVAYQRVEHEAQVREELEVISHQLAMISDLVSLRHQRALTLAPSAEAERFKQDLEETRSAVREIDELEAAGRLPAAPVACA